MSDLIGLSCGSLVVFCRANFYRAIIQAGLHSFLVRRVLDRFEAGELSVREATKALERENSRTAATPYGADIRF